MVSKPTGKPVGRPRDPDWPKEKIIALGKEMLEWVKSEAAAYAFHLSEFYIIKKDISPSDWNLLRHRPEFLHYYEKAIQIMGTIIIKNSRIPTAYGSRFLSIYFKDLREHEREIKREEIETAAKTKIEIDSWRSIPANDSTITLEIAHAKREGELLARIKELEGLNGIVSTSTLQ